MKDPFGQAFDRLMQEAEARILGRQAAMLEKYKVALGAPIDVLPPTPFLGVKSPEREQRGEP